MCKVYSVLICLYIVLYKNNNFYVYLYDLLDIEYKCFLKKNIVY